MNIWELKIGNWRPVYEICLYYLRYAPWDFLKEYLRHGVVGHSPRHVRFENKDGIIFDLNVRECVQKAIFCFHYFEPEDVGAIRQFIKPGCVFFDVGANIGQYALLASKLTGNQGRVFAFEPSPVVRPRLQHNIALNAFENIEVVPCAVAATTATMQFYMANEEGNQGVGSLMPAEEYRAQTRASESIEVDVITLDSFCEQQQIKHVDVLKIDVEGFDLEVLKGAVQLIARNPNLVIMSEVEPLNLVQLGYTPEDFYAFMRAHDFLPWYAEKHGKLKRLEVEGKTLPYHPNVFFLHKDNV